MCLFFLDTFKIFLFIICFQQFDYDAFGGFLCAYSAYGSLSSWDLSVYIFHQFLKNFIHSFLNIFLVLPYPLFLSHQLHVFQTILLLSYGSMMLYALFFSLFLCLIFGYSRTRTNNF